ncbi:hypothetical protein ZEAMMB73_Zm00001d050602, partial [Zea mays]
MRSSRRCAACGGFLQGGEHGGGARSSRGTGQEHWRGEEIEEALCFLGVPRQHLGAVTCLSIITIFIIPHKISPVSNLSMFDYNDYHRTIDCILQIAVKKLNPESVQGLQEWQVTIECSGLFSTPVRTEVRIGASFTLPWFYCIDHLGWA